MLTAALAFSLLHSQTTATWSSLEEPYAYKHLDFSQVTETSEQANGQTVVRFTFPSPAGDPVHGILVEPNGSVHVPCAILLHGLGESKDGLAATIGKNLIAKGVAYAAIDAPGHGQRASAADKKTQQDIGMVFLTAPERGDLLRSAVKRSSRDEIIGYLSRAVLGGIVDARHLLDYVTSRKEIDHNHVGLIGNSMGSIMSTILGSVDNRPACAALMVGGDPVLP